MSAVSQSYPNYLGGLNEQPDEIKKPGQLVEALNVIPDPTIGLTRRPGFEEINSVPVAGRDGKHHPEGTWFEMEASNQVNQDYIYFGHITTDGVFYITNQDGERQLVRYTDESISPHKTYLYNNDVLEVFDENNELLETHDVDDITPNGYFRHAADNPIKYCVSKSHVIFTNPKEKPTLAQAKTPTDDEENKYYSFINLKVIDTENYNYTFRRFYGDDTTDTYTYIKDISLDSVEDLGDGYDQDLTMPLQTQGPFRFNIEPNDPNADVKESAIVEVTFRGQAVQLQSSDGDGYRNEARYTWSVKIIDPGKGFKKGNKVEILPALNSSEPDVTLSDLRLNFKIDEVTKVTATRNELVVLTTCPTTTVLKISWNLLISLSSLVLTKSWWLVVVFTLNNQFSISTSEIAVADVLNSQKMEDDKVPIVRVNTVAELPVECYSGFIVEVTNSFDNKNNYYLEYVAESEVDEDLDNPSVDQSRWFLGGNCQTI